MPTYEGLRLKINKYNRKIFAKSRRKQLDGRPFTVFSNNCWGGILYESYHLRKDSPTVGMWILPKDYIRFLKNPKEYTQAELRFIPPEESRGQEISSQDERFGHYPIGRICISDDPEENVEIHFLHYHSEEEAKDKWERRCKRIHWDRLLVKFNDQNGCTQEDVEAFFKLPYQHMIFFTCRRWEGVDEAIVIKQYGKKDYLTTSHEPLVKTDISIYPRLSMIYDHTQNIRKLI